MRPRSTPLGGVDLGPPTRELRLLLAHALAQLDLELRELVQEPLTEALLLRGDLVGDPHAFGRLPRLEPPALLFVAGLELLGDAGLGLLPALPQLGELGLD